MQIIGGDNESRKLTNGSKNFRQNENKVTYLDRVEWSQ